MSRLYLSPLIDSTSLVSPDKYNLVISEQAPNNSNRVLAQKKYRVML